MKTIRRLYFYSIAFISLEVVLWGIIGLIRSIFDDVVVDNAQALAQALSLILVGVPIFLFHWLWAQRLSAQDDEEKTSSLRAIFLYGVLLATLVPAVQNFLALTNRLFLSTANLYAERAIVGGLQSWQDNLIAILINLLIAVYFWSVLKEIWQNLPEKDDFSDVRRLSRFIWMLYGLSLAVYGAQQALDYAFTLVDTVLGDVGRETAINAIALLIVGSPIWYSSWSVIQQGLPDPAEKDSYLRLGVLYLLSLGSVVTVLTAGGSLLYIILMRIFGEASSWSDFFQQIGAPLSVGVPFGVIWVYYGDWLNRQFSFEEDVVRRAGKKRLYYYILSFAGLAVVFFGALSLISIMIDLATDSSYLGENGFRSPLAGSLSALIVGLPLWLRTWRPMQAEAFANDETGGYARRSGLRRTYLYLVIFSAVIGGMISAGALLYSVITEILGGTTYNFADSLLTNFSTLLLCVVLLLYHLYILRRDTAIQTDALEEKQAQFRVVAFDSHDGRFGAEAISVFSKYASKLPVTVLKPTDPVPADTKANALILPGSLALDLPENVKAWIRSFGGSKFIVEDEAAGVYWANGIAQAAESAQAIAEGQEVRPRSSKTMSPILTYTLYIFAGLFACQLLFFLIVFVVSMLTEF